MPSNEYSVLSNQLHIGVILCKYFYNNHLYIAIFGCNGHFFFIDNFSCDVILHVFCNNFANDTAL